MKNEYLIGCNYWASNLGVYTWRGYDKAVVEKDMQVLSSHGVNVLRIFPLWEDFQPLSRNLYNCEELSKKRIFKMRVGDNPLLYEKFPDSGLDPVQADNMNHLIKTADRYGLKIIVSFITGWMSGRKFVPKPFVDKNLISDAEVVLYECKFIKDLIGEIKDNKNVIAYEPGNETNCLDLTLTNKFVAELWCKSITDTIRLADPTRPVYAGMHGTSCFETWNIPMQSKYFDMVTPHPYPPFTPYCQNERVTAMRAAMHAAAESSYYRGVAQKPSMIQEIGTLGPMFLSNDHTPEYLESSLITSFASGSSGFLWWCAFDQDNLDFSPYDVNACENELGLCYSDQTPKPVLKKLKEMRNVIDEIGVLPPPDVDAIAVITNATEEWKAAYGAYMLGAQSGKIIDFVAEGTPMRKTDYYICPSYDSLDGLNKYQFNEILKEVENGANLLITNDNTGVRYFEKVTGLKVIGNEKIDHVKTFTLNGKEISIKCSYLLDVEATTADVIAVDNNGKIAISQNKYGKGLVTFVNAPLEYYYTEINYPEETNLYEIYSFFFKNKEKAFAVNSPKLYVTTHTLNDNNVGVVLYNFDKTSTVLPVKISENYKVVKTLYSEIIDDKIKLNERYAYVELSKK